MKSIVWNIIWIYMGVCFVSCQDFLEEHPKTFISPDDFYQNQSHAEAGVNAIYSVLTWNGGYGNFFPIAEFPTDQAILAYPGQATYLVLEKMTFDSANGVFETMWQHHYDAINKANFANQRIPGTPELNDSNKNALLAEVRFLRALYYFNLVRWFGDVPLITEPTENIQNLDVPRDSQESVYSQIIEDLKFAISYLPDHPREIGRVGKVAAKVLLGKVYITMAGEPLKQADKWGQAKNVLSEVISKEASQYLFEDYLEMWKEENENDEEFIFSAQFNGVDYNNYTPRRFAPRSSGIQGGESYGEIAPSAKFIKSFEDGDLRLKLFKTEYPRYNNDEMVKFDKPYCFKYFDVCHSARSGINYPIIRYADALLLYAEAANEIAYGDSKAFECINAIRKRVNLSLLKVEDLDQDSFRKAVWNERNHELCFEGHRWFDLIRTGEFISTLKDVGKKVQDNHKLFPLPQREIDENKSLKQNSGY